MRKPERVWLQLIDEAQTLPTNTQKSRYYKFLSEWAISNVEAIGRDVVNKYGLLDLAEFDPDQYAIEQTKSGVTFLKERLKLRNPKSADVIAMFIRDDLESIIVFKVKRNCVNCESMEMGVWKLVQDDVQQLVYVCELCSFAKFENGEPFHKGKIIIAEKFDLMTEGLL